MPRQTFEAGEKVMVKGYSYGANPWREAEVVEPEVTEQSYVYVRGGQRDVHYVKVKQRRGQLEHVEKVINSRSHILGMAKYAPVKARIEAALAERERRLAEHQAALGASYVEHATALQEMGQNGVSADDIADYLEEHFSLRRYPR